MINTKDLEKRWYKYKAKHVFLLLLLVFLLVALPYALYYIFDYFNSQSSLNSETKTAYQVPVNVHAKGSLTSKVETNQTETVAETNTVKESVDSNVTLSPTIPIVDLEREKQMDKKQAQRYAAAKKRKQHNAPKKNLVRAKASAALTPQELAVIQGRDLPRQKKNVTFAKSSDNYIEVMQAKFNQNKHPREALLLAKAYYASGEYAKAEEWALRANKLDKSLVESWLLFAKSKVKLGKEQEALKVLSSFYRSSKSPRAKELIGKIKTRSI